LDTAKVTNDAGGLSNVNCTGALRAAVAKRTEEDMVARMTFEEFTALTSAGNLPAPLAALWHHHRGDWNAAHQAAQDDEGEDAAWVHAHLHRAEGDASNAAYWYRRARRPVPEAGTELTQEREAITRELLAKHR
jgi:hypothetical protein